MPRKSGASKGEFEGAGTRFGEVLGVLTRENRARRVEFKQLKQNRTQLVAQYQGVGHESLGDS